VKPQLDLVGIAIRNEVMGQIDGWLGSLMFTKLLPALDKQSAPLSRIGNVSFVRCNDLVGPTHVKGSNDPSFRYHGNVSVHLS